MTNGIKKEDCGLASLQSPVSPISVCHTDDTVILSQIQEELNSKFAKHQPYRQQLASDYYVLGSMDEAFAKRFEKVQHCGEYLRFGITNTGKHKLISANFCKDVLCPVCNWRRSLKYYGVVAACCSQLQSAYDFLLVTLTIKNCTADKLGETCDLLVSSIKKLRRQANIKNAVKGYFWALEITYNRKDKTYHPHIHMIWAVDKNYFFNRGAGGQYISKDVLIQAWAQALGVDYLPSVDIKKIGAQSAGNSAGSPSFSIEKTVAEVAKYAVKAVDYIGDLDVVRSLAGALQNRKKCDFQGIFKTAYHDLRVNDDDLVHVEVDSIQEEIIGYVHAYWNGSTYQLVY